MPRTLTRREVHEFDHVPRAVAMRARLLRVRRLPPGAHGLTLGRRVLLVRGHEGNQKLLAHELVHVRQFGEQGRLRFLATYGAAYLVNLVRLRRHRAAYLAIPAEAEARAETAAWVLAHRESSVTGDRRGPALASLAVSGGPEPWAAAGFTLVDGQVILDTVTVRAQGVDEPAGIQAWGLTEVEDGVVDGLLTVAAGTTEAGLGDHPNTAVAIDHLVVASPDLERTTVALAAFGIDLRRIRDAGRMEQRFFRVGPVLLELVGAPGAHGPGPATFWGLAITVADLATTADLLGPHLGPVSEAVQPGRRIATLRHEALGLPVRIAFMTPPPPRPAP